MKIETKYSIGDNVWLMCENKARLKTITNIDIHISCTKVKTEYTVDGTKCYCEADLFTTKDELLQSL